LGLSACTTYQVTVEEIDLTSPNAKANSQPKKITGQSQEGSSLVTENVAKSNEKRVILAKAPEPSKPISRPSSAAWIWPTLRENQYKRVSGEEQNGLDIFGKLGDPIYAVAPGRVMYAGDALKNLGNLVIVRHSGQWVSVYAHVQKILVKEGDTVNAGQKVALLGNSGPSKETKLYFEIRKEGKAVDPYQKITPPQK
jgi:lipoprotein NlpD